MASNFHPIEFPAGLAFGAGCGVQFETELTLLASGHEIRNGRWQGGRRHYVLTIGPIRLVQMRRLSVFFEARAGRRYGFLYRDWLDDHTGTGLPSPYDEELQPADPARHLFPLWKTYQSSADEAAPAPMRRRIFTPQATTLQVMRGDRLLQSQIDYQLQPRSGIIRLTEALAPDETLTAGFYFYVPVRFDVDRLNVDMVGSDLAQVTALPLIELPASELLE